MECRTGGKGQTTRPSSVDCNGGKRLNSRKLIGDLQLKSDCLRWYSLSSRLEEPTRKSPLSLTCVWTALDTLSRLWLVFAGSIAWSSLLNETRLRWIFRISRSSSFASWPSCLPSLSFSRSFFSLASTIFLISLRRRALAFSPSSSSAVIIAQQLGSQLVFYSFFKGQRTYFPNNKEFSIPFWI